MTGFPERLRRACSFGLICSTFTLLSACGEQARDLGGVHIEFLEGNRLVISAMNEDTTWLDASGVRDTSWRAESTRDDGTGFAWSIVYDLDFPTTGPCFLLLKIQLPSRDTPVPVDLPVGTGADQLLPRILANFGCPDAWEELLHGTDRVRETWVDLTDGQMELEEGAWPALMVG